MDIAIWAVVVAAASSFFLGTLWCPPILFDDGSYHTAQFALFGVVLGLWP